MPSIRSLIVFSLSLFFSTHAFGVIQLDVVIEGVDGDIKNNVLSYLSIEQQKSHPNLTEGRIHRLHHKASGEIKSALQPFGYYQPEIQARLEHEKDKWSAYYLIDTGLPVLVSGIDIRILGDGAQDSRFQQLIRDFPLHAGDILEHARYEKGRSAFLQLTTERGYFDAQLLKHEIVVQPDQFTAAVTLHIDTGQRYKFGKMIFKQEVLNEDLLKDYVTFAQGDPYSTDQLLDLQNALTDSDYFSQVDVRGNRETVENHEVPIEVTLLPRMKHLYTLGFGYGTDTGPRGTIGWENRRINKSGHRIGTELKASEVKNTVTARYEIPIRNPRTDNVSLTAAWVQDDPKTSTSETLLWGISRTISRHINWLETIYLNYQSESFEVAGDDKQEALFLPGISWSRIKADDRILTKHGSRLWLDFKTGIGTNTNLAQTRLSGKLVRSPGDNSRFLLRGDIGASDVTEFSELPVSLRFFTGGDQTVRGYSYNSLGPANTDGEIVGGKHLLVGSVEYEHKISGNWSGAVFYDAGNALNDFSEDLKHGAGIGLRWKTFIGPIRLDYAWALSIPGNPERIHLSIGPDL